MKTYGIELDIHKATVCITLPERQRITRSVRRRSAQRMIAELLRHLPELISPGEDIELRLSIRQESPLLADLKAKRRTEGA